MSIASNSRPTGLVASGTSPDGSLVEIVELPEHPWFVAVQFHPEFKSKPTALTRCSREFVAAARRHKTAGWGETSSGESRRLA